MEVFISVLLVAILGNLIYLERKVASIDTKIKNLPCQQQEGGQSGEQNS